MANKNQSELIEKVKYIASGTSKMSRKVIGKTFPITSLTVFSHSQQEYEFLINILEEIGETYNFNNGPRVKLYESIKVGENFITHLRIRKPDVERPQVGCNDFDTDYQLFKNQYLLRFPDNLCLIKRQDYEMIELRDNDYDVLAYVVSS